jgi:HK97 family phage major capsid protein
MSKKSLAWIACTFAMAMVLFIYGVDLQAVSTMLPGIPSGDIFMAVGAAAATGGPDAVTRELNRIAAETQEFSRKGIERIGEIQNRVASVEQVVAQISQGGVASGLGVRQSLVGALVRGALEEHGENVFTDMRRQAGALQLRQQGTRTGIKALLVNDDGMASSDEFTFPSQPERRGVVLRPQRPLRLLEALPSRPTGADSIEFIQLHSDDSAASQQGEGAEKANLDFEGLLVKARIETIAGHTTASKQVLSDHAALLAGLRMVMNGKCLSELERQLIVGDGSDHTIVGMLSQSTVFVPTIASQPADVIGESLTAQANAGYSPNLVVLNPMDWFELQITRTATDEEYLFGSPTAPIAPSLWNTPVVATPSMPRGTALTIDTSYVTVIDREQPNMTVSNSHKDYFTRNLVLLLGELRAGLEVLDSWAIYQVDLPFSS